MKLRPSLLLSLILVGASMQSNGPFLLEAPHQTEKAHEILLVHNQNLAEHFNALTPQERVFIYYMFRASLPGNIIAADQSHRDSLKIRELLEYILEHKDYLLRQETAFDTEDFLQDVETFLIYLWSNHSVYFCREAAQEKRTPQRLNLEHLTQKNLIAALEKLQFPHAQQEVDAIAASLFDTNCEATQTVPGTISKSAVNFYSSDFTDEDFASIDGAGQTALNAYFYIDKKDESRIPRYQLYSVDGKYSREISVMVYWLQKAHDHARMYPDQFDAHLVKSLSFLIDYFKTGDESFFKQHSIEWLQSNSKLDYVFGFIETYDDPKSYRALFQSDITIKSVDINALNQLLPDIERALPIKKDYMRQTLQTEHTTMPNASINVKAFSAGSLGPCNITLAYCLPNYAEIRSEHGSKQIIYHAEKSLSELMNAKKAHRLLNGADYYKWFETHDPDHQLMRDIFMLEVILHETLGHASGRLTTHTFKEGEPLTIAGKTYAVGDTISVTSSNLQQFLAGYDQTLEELRAEIIALLASIVCHDELAEIGMLKDWPEKVSKETIIDFSILNMARTGLRRLIQQADNATEIAGDHARANTTILHYLLDKNVIELQTESVDWQGEIYSVLDVSIIDREKAVAAITELANLVQEIKSTGDGLRAQWLIETFGKRINPTHLKIMKDNVKAVVGDVKVSAMIYPLYMPRYNEKNDIVDVLATWPESFTEEYQLYKKWALSTD